MERRQAQPHGQRVQAGGDAEDKERNAGGRVAPFGCLGLLLLERLGDHPAAHDKEKNKSQPVVVPSDVLDDGLARRPARAAHDKLEQAEGRRQPNGLLPGRGAQGHTHGDGNGEGVHRQGEGDPDNEEKSHIDVSGG